MPQSICPQCRKSLSLSLDQWTDRGDIFECPECEAVLVVTQVNPIKLRLYSNQSQEKDVDGAHESSQIPNDISLPESHESKTALRDEEHLRDGEAAKGRGGVHLRNTIPKERIVIVCGSILIVLAGLYPPWTERLPYGIDRAGPYSPIWRPPAGDTVDLARLGIEWIVIVVLTGLVLFLFRKKG